jgi:hypothetical protein
MNEENTTNPEVVETPSTEAPTTPTAPEPGSNEYNATMAAEGAVALGQVPDKFKNEDGTVNMEAFIKSYSELETKLHSPEQKEEVPVINDGPDAVVDELRVPEVEEETVLEEEQAAKVGVTAEDLGHMTTEIMKTGNITEEQRAVLNQRGVDDTVIDTMVEGQRARMRQQYAAAADIVGGSDRLSKIFGWAAHNLNDMQRTQINAGLASDASEITLRGLASMYDQSVPTNPVNSEMASQSTKPSSMSAGREVTVGYKTKADYYQDYDVLMKNPHDLKLRDKIESRMQKTDWAVIQ